jgi:hypothetical protein
MKSKIYRVKGELELEEMGNGDYTLWFRSNKGKYIIIAEIADGKIINGFRFENPRLFWEKINELIKRRQIKNDD